MCIAGHFKMELCSGGIFFGNGNLQDATMRACRLPIYHAFACFSLLAISASLSSPSGIGAVCTAPSGT